MRPIGAASYLAIALVSLAVVLYQLTLLRVFSFTIWHHYAFMVISIALLGFGISGTILQVRARLADRALHNAGLFAAVFALTAVSSVWIVARIPFDPARIADEPGQLLYLGLYYVVLTIPFTFAGLTVVLLLKHYAADVDRLYAADLAGAALGAASAVSVMNAVAPQGAVFFSAAAACLAGALLVSGPAVYRTAPAALAILLAIASPWAQDLLIVPAGQSKGLTRLLDRSQQPDAKLIATHWDAMSRVDVVSDSGSIAWTRNPQAGIEPPAQHRVVIDGDAETPIVLFDGDIGALSFLDHLVPTVGIQALKPARVLVIGSGGGLDVLGSLRHGALHVDAVEINPLIHEMATERFAESNGNLFARDDVTLHLDEGRSFVRRSDQQYDAILLSLVDTWAATASGAYSLSESYLYTVEAFEDYLEHLNDDGFVTVSRWGWSPPREMLRLVTVADAALTSLGVARPHQNIVVLASGKVGTLIVKKTAFTADELNQLATVSQRSQFFPIYAPNLPESKIFGEYLRTNDKAGFVRAYEFDVSPVTDDRPFFFQFGRWSNLQLLGQSWREAIFILSGRLVLLAVLIQAALLSLLLLVLPRWVARTEQEQERAGRVLGYFLLIGLAFMFVEIALMQRFTLYLGNPLYATALVLGALLASAGTGSYFSRSLLTRTAPLTVFGALFATTLLASFSLPILFEGSMGAPLVVRVIVSVAAIFPIGFLMGVPFPAAIAQLDSSGRQGLIGWAWAANGCASVLGPILAVLIGIDVGLQAVLMAGGALYLAAWFIFARSWQPSG